MKFLSALFFTFILFISPDLVYAQQGISALSDGPEDAAVQPAVLGKTNFQGLSLFNEWDLANKSANRLGTKLTLDDLQFQYSLNPWSNSTANQKPASRIILGSGNNQFSLGDSYSWRWDSTDGKANRFGMLYKPNSAFNLSGFWNYEIEYKINTWSAGAAFFPLSFWSEKKAPILSLSGQVDWKSKGSTNYLAGAQISPWDGFSVLGQWDKENKLLTVKAKMAIESFRLSSNIDSEKKGSSELTYTWQDSQKKVPIFNQNQILVWTGATKVLDTPPTLFDKHLSLRAWITMLENWADDPSIAGLAFTSPLEVNDWAVAEELHEALKRFQAQGKKLFVWAENLTGPQYLIYSSSDKILLHPSGVVDLKGFQRTGFYLKDFLASFGVSVVNFRSHPYKTFGNTFSESDMTDAEKESWQTMLDSWQTQLIDELQESRGDDKNVDTADWIKDGPFWNADKAKSAKLVDGLGFSDECKTLWSGKKNYSWREISQGDQFPKNTSGFSPQIAILYAQGDIVSGTGRAGRMIGSDDWVKELSKLEHNIMISGVIIRVNSGGGSALASRSIARQISSLAKVKPVIISMGGMAASGGYYLSSAGSTIIASPYTITGSIGVVAVFPQLEGLLNLLKIHTATVKTSPLADFPSLFKDLTSDEKAVFEDMISHEYSSFTGFVATQRNISKVEVDKVAQGRVWSGLQAKEKKLVDRIGGLQDAIDLMKEKLNSNSLQIQEETPDSNSFEIGDLLNTKTALLGPWMKAWDYKIEAWQRMSTDKTWEWLDSGIE